MPFLQPGIITMLQKSTSLLLCVLLSAVPLLSACSPQNAPSEQDEWISLFNGDNLDGWTKEGGSATYEVDDGTILGTSGEGPNTFLVSEDTYQDFELVAEVKLEDDPLNSGIQIRSVSEERNGYPHLVGPQVEIEAAPPVELQSGTTGEAGYIYSEATGRGWLSEDREPLQVFNNGEWNTYRIRAVGDRIQTWINDTPVADIRDPESNQEGHIGLQVHSVPDDDAHWQVRWRNIRIRPIEAGS